jgi:hypothetical protein
MSGIRPRVLAIALIPSAALFITGVGVAGSLISDGLSARDFASVNAESSGTLTSFQAAVENERTISLRALGGDRQALAGLQSQWNATDAVFARTSRAAAAVQSVNAQALGSNSNRDRLLGNLPAVRREVQARQVSATTVDAFYTQLVNLGSAPLLLNALSAPNSGVAVNMTATLDMLSAIDLHSRAAGLGAGWTERGVLSNPERLQLAQLTGAYRNDLQALAFRLTPAEQAVYRRLASGGRGSWPRPAKTPWRYAARWGCRCPAG